jgi:xanthine dehydrogenase accessory factor
MKKIYRSLLEELRAGREAVLVTRLSPSGTQRALYVGDELAAWEGKRGEENSLHVERNGDEITVVERFAPRPRMIIFGSGHIAEPLSVIASMLGFSVTVFDDRPSFANKERFPLAAEVICDGFSEASRRIELRQSDYVVIATRGHRHDQQCLRFVLDSEPPRYVSMISSRRRAIIVRQQMEEEGYPSWLVKRLHSPAGISIGSATPEEIAVSIMAEAVRERRMSGDGTVAVEQDADVDLIEQLAGEERLDAAIVTVLSTTGSTPRGAGAKMAVFPGGRSAGSVGGGCAEAEVMRDARDIITKGGYKIRYIDMTDPENEDGMACGGRMELLIESTRNLETDVD